MTRNILAATIIMLISATLWSCSGKAKISNQYFNNVPEEALFLIGEEAIRNTQFATGECAIDVNTYEQSLHGVKGYSHDADDNNAMIEYNINRAYQRFRAVAGVDDNSPYPEEKYIFRVYVDDKLSFERELGRSEPFIVDIDVEGALRVRLEIQCAGLGDDALEGLNHAWFANPHVIPGSDSE
jgi:hypothetical protein